MRKITVDKLEPGMILAKPITGPTGMVMLAQGTELNEKWIERVRDMEIAIVSIEGSPVQAIPEEEALAELEARFALVNDKPFMGLIKKAVREHTKGLYK
ncbi:MAG TPA: hypothetical protein PLB14_02810 [Smithellaceae bacterium]|nr:hypothetical protein [Syntrophaceae bacterium]HPL96049.1 hypothetical protein [Smithellaceae bacterium]HPV48610.1 hypothetical protein [Smithellaceae bacterium]